MPIPTIQGTAGIVNDPEQRSTNSGIPLLVFRLAFNDSKYNEQTQKWDTTKTFYVDTVAWDDVAKRLVGKLAKGDQVYVEGRIETQSWEKDGEKKSKPSLNVRTVRKLQKNDAPSDSQSGGFVGGNAPANSNQGGGWNAPAADPWGAPAADPSGDWGNLGGQPMDQPTF